MGELAEKQWAVMSERGREAAGLTYEEAARLVNRLKDEKVSGVCVITASAAERLARAAADNKNGRPAHAQSKREASPSHSKDS